MKKVTKLIRDITVSMALVAVILTILSLIYAGMNVSQGAEPGCLLKWEYPSTETRHYGFKMTDTKLGVIWDSGSNQSIRSVSCSDLGLKRGVKYKLSIFSYHPEIGDSDLSNYVEVKISHGKLDEPSNLTVEI